MAASEPAAKPPTPFKDRLQSVIRTERIRVGVAIGVIVGIIIVAIGYPAQDVVIWIPAQDLRTGAWGWLSPWLPSSDVVIVVPGSRRLEWVLPWTTVVPQIARWVAGLVLGMVVATIGLRWDALIRTMATMVESSGSWTYLRIRIPQTATITPDQTVTFFRSIVDMLPSSSPTAPSIILSYTGEAQQSVVQGILIGDDATQRSLIPSLLAVTEGMMIDEMPSYPYLASNPKLPWRAVSIVRAVGQEGIPLAPATDPLGIAWVGALVAAILRIPTGCAGAVIGIAPSRTPLGELERGSLRDTLREEGVNDGMVDRMVPEAPTLMRVLIRLFARAATKEQAQAIVASLEQAVIGKREIVRSRSATWNVVARATWSDTDPPPDRALLPSWVVWGWAVFVMGSASFVGWSIGTSWQWGGLIVLSGMVLGTGGLWWWHWRDAMQRIYQRWVTGIAMDSPQEPIRFPWIPRWWRRY